MTSQNASSTSAATPAKGPSRVQAITANELRFVPNPTFSIIDPSPSPPLSPLNTALVKDTRRYIYPFTGHTLGNRAVANRPRIRNTWRQWPPCTSSHPFLFTNPGTLCYRDASLTFLLASPALFNWSAAHVRGSAWTCLIRDCLVCAFHALGTEYWNEDRQGNALKFEARAQEIWDLCLKVFWGPRARTKRKLGPTEIDKEGGSNTRFTLWFIRLMREQVRARPSEVQTFKRIFYSEFRTQPKCSNELCTEPYPAIYSDASYMVLIVSLKTATITYLLSRALNSKSLTKTFCVVCASAKQLTYEVSYLNAAENLIFHVSRRDGSMNDCLQVTLEETISLPVHEKAKVDYALTAIMWLHVSDGSGPDHASTTYRSKDGELRNSDNGYRFKSWQEIFHQAQSKKGGKMYPEMFLYTRIDGGAATQQIIATSPSLVQNPLSPTLTNSSEDLDRRSSSSSLATKLSKVQLRGDSKPPRRGRRPVTRRRPAKPVLAEQTLTTQQDFILSTCCAAFTQITRTRMRKILERHNFHLPTAYTELIFGEQKPRFPPRYTLDMIPLQHLEVVLKTLIAYPERSLDEIVDTLEECQGSLDEAALKLDPNRKIDLWHSETVGSAEVMTKYEIAPSDALGVPALMSEKQHVKGSVTYKLNGKTWYGTVSGDLWRTDL